MLSQRVLSLKPSPTLALAAKAKELKSQGEDVISLSVGEPDWDTFDGIKQAGIVAIQEGYTKYTPAAGLPELRKAIAKQTNNDLGTKYEMNNVTVSTGGKFILFSALQSLVNPGDEVIVPAPYWVSYPTMVELAGGTPIIVTCKKSENYKLTPEMLEASITDKTKVLILNSPSNPTGCMYDSKELASLAEVLQKHKDVVILSDDIYNRLVFLESGLSPHILQQEMGLLDRTLVINGVAKTYSMTGWRVGWALGPVEIISAMTRYQSQSVSCATGMSQMAALHAIEHGQEDVANAVKALKARRDFSYTKFNELPHVDLENPEGAFYLWPDFSYYMGKKLNGKTLANSKELAGALLEDQMVAAVPGIEFGLEGYLRVSYALSEKRMGEAVQRIKTFLDRLE